MYNYYSRKLRIPFEEAVKNITATMRQQGFGIITKIDLKEVFRQKLDVVFRNYTILGACNPEFAHKAVSLESHIGLMLPCNIVIQEHENGEVEISAISPLDNLDKSTSTVQLRGLAGEVGTRLRTAIDDLHRDRPDPDRAEALPLDSETPHSPSQHSNIPIQG